MRPDRERSAPAVEDVSALAAQAASDGVVGAFWSLVSSDLNLNMVRLGAGEAIAPHVNAEVDVVGLVILGEGKLLLEEELGGPLRTGLLFFVPKGARRSIQAGDAGLVYLTCHRRRGGLTIGRGGRGT
jgi:hypothetical protein